MTSDSLKMITNDYDDLKTAIEILEHATFCDRVTRLIGMPLDAALERLPDRWNRKLEKLAQSAVNTAFKWVLKTVAHDAVGNSSRDWTHKVLVAGSGAVGGFFGGFTAAVEIPVSTGIMMRTIADIARSEGEDLSDLSARMACMEVLALDTTGSKTGLAKYYGLRRVMSGHIVNAAEYLLAGNGVSTEGAPVVVQLLHQIAKRFETNLVEKYAAELVPVIGAVGGGTINYMFIDHYQRIAHGHFIIRRLERKYGQEVVELAYHNVCTQLASPVLPHQTISAG